MFKFHIIHDPAAKPATKSSFSSSATAAKAPSRTYTRPPSTITAPASSLVRIGQQSPAATPLLTISAIDPSHYQFVDLPPPGIFQNFFGFDHRSLAGLTWLRSSLSSRLRSSHLLNSITGASKHQVHRNQAPAVFSDRLLQSLSPAILLFRRVTGSSGFVISSSADSPARFHPFADPHRRNRFSFSSDLLKLNSSIVFFRPVLFACFRNKLIGLGFFLFLFLFFYFVYFIFVIPCSGECENIFRPSSFGSSEQLHHLPSALAALSQQLAERPPILKILTGFLFNAIVETGALSTEIRSGRFSNPSWYKGTYEDRVILVKKIRQYPPSQEYIGQCIKDVVVASQMSNHKNVLKPLGCCLETEIPLLVCEFAARGSLSDYMYEEEIGPSYLSWESRLRIATEIADAVTYLHNGTSKSIIHRAINCRNILLDEHYVAKLSNFGHSISIPLGETHVDADLSTFYTGSVAPESKRIRRFTEKTDVYSFGAVLFEILTGKRVSNILKEVYSVLAEKRCQLLNCKFLMIEDNEEDIRVYLKANIITGNTEQLMACAELAIRCVKVKPEERPSMMEVAKELRRITRFQ
ncbi:hypothetical protein HHK36_032439 [Tetracentron sinense]|uniref:Protein kinase domain-containing protein n=1 Tax=Tetracentron sinense TaxID=13715 RepID=A0A834Y7X5_TETSI|nr:hypothetical protein HHK36_032439 [Tetracentron sinense]